MPRMRRQPKQRMTRTAFSPELEAFIAGDDAALSDPVLMRTLAAELYWTELAKDCRVPDADFRVSAIERRRLDLLTRRYEKQRAADDLKYYSALARNGGVFNRFTILLKAGDDPSFAFCEANGPGPNSTVVNVPKDDEAEGLVP